MDSAKIYQQVQAHYGECAKDNNKEYSQRVAKAFGYSEDELAKVPEGANLGLSCGNPLGFAKVKADETVIDLGSGAGFDVFLAAKNLGPNGKVIGVDMNKDMLERANKNKLKAGLNNVSFVESPITNINLPSSMADCIISNCVINLLPESEKQLVFNEIFRLLRPGGRVAISDILAKKELPPDLRNDLALHAGCIAGASQVRQYEQYLQDAGFQKSLIINSNHDLNAYRMSETDTPETSCCGPNVSNGDKAPSRCGDQVAPTPELGQATNGAKVSAKFADVDFNELVGSYHVYAVKP